MRHTVNTRKQCSSFRSCGSPQKIVGQPEIVPIANYWNWNGKKLVYKEPKLVTLSTPEKRWKQQLNCE